MRAKIQGCARMADKYAVIRSLVGARDELLKIIEAAFDTKILVRGNEIVLTGETAETERVSRLFEELMSSLDLDPAYGAFVGRETAAAPA